MEKKNGGFSLIELIVSVAILSIVSLMAMGFMTSGAQSFSSVSGNVNLQIRSQLAMGNIQEKLIDCNFGLDFHDDTNTLYIINVKTDPDTGAPVYTASIYALRDGAVYYGEDSCVLDSPGRLIFSGAANDLLAKGVAEFSVTFQSHLTLEGGLTLSGATVDILFTERRREFRDVQTTALRNSPLPVIVTTAALPPP